MALSLRNPQHLQSRHLHGTYIPAMLPKAFNICVERFDYKARMLRRSLELKSRGTGYIEGASCSGRSSCVGLPSPILVLLSYVDSLVWDATRGLLIFYLTSSKMGFCPALVAS